jgi:hypothetical protein
VSSITATELAPFGVVVGPSYQPRPAQTVTVSNVGTTTVTLTKPTSANYDIGNLSKSSILAGETATFTVKPKDALNFGPYDETLVINGKNGTTDVSAEVFASFAVVLNPVDSLSASPLVVEFGSAFFLSGAIIAATERYTPPPAQTVTVTNTGTGTLTGLTVSGASSYDIGALTATTLTSGATATFTVRPKSTLTSANIYNEQVTIEGTVSGSNPAIKSVAVDLRFLLTSTLVSTISASPKEVAFGSLPAPYAQPSAKTITITNTGTRDINLNQPILTNYIIGNLMPTNVVAPGKTVTFTIRPKAGLPAGDYSVSMTITGDNGATATVPVTFRVMTGPEITIITQPAAVTSVSFNAITGSLDVEAGIDPPSDGDDVGGAASGSGGAEGGRILPLAGQPSGGYALLLCGGVNAGGEVRHVGVGDGCGFPDQGDAAGS